MLALTLTFVASCGRKTDPLVPESPRPETVQDVKIVARDGVAFLDWPIPVRNIEGKEMNPAEIELFQVFRAELGSDRKKARYRQYAEIDMTRLVNAMVKNGRVFWRDGNLRYGQAYGYRIRAVSARGGRSQFSEEARVVPLLSLSAPTGVTAAGRDSENTIQWSPVNTRSDGSVYTGFVGYNLYRGTASGRQAETPLNKEPLRTTFYRDMSVLNGVRYYYFVRAVDSPAPPWKESLDSAEVTAMSRDLTPPSRPAGLTVVPGVGRIFLTWNENRDRDLAGYFVYRSRRSGRDYERLTEKPVNRTTYSDETAKPGIQYFYVVAAVDQSGNESSFSKEHSAYAEKTR
jgi:fibronectin type 3 domain-containing protein